jgi:hypothetical protein
MSVCPPRRQHRCVLARDFQASIQIGNRRVRSNRQPAWVVAPDSWPRQPIHDISARSMPLGFAKPRIRTGITLDRWWS